MSRALCHKKLDLDRYRHTSQLHVTEETEGTESGGEICGPMVARKVAAHLILSILSKLGTSWMREPKRLSGKSCPTNTEICFKE
jgi:hypothetical protein